MGDKALKASGSSAQANAMTRFVTAYESIAGADSQLHVQWFGCGVSEFIGGITDFGGSDSPLNDDKGGGGEGCAGAAGQSGLESAHGCSVRLRSLTTWRASTDWLWTGRFWPRYSTARSPAGML